MFKYVVWERDQSTEYESESAVYCWRCKKETIILHKMTADIMLRIEVKYLCQDCYNTYKIMTAENFLQMEKWALKIPIQQQGAQINIKSLEKGEKQGRCLRCQLRFIWRGLPRVKDALCSRCGNKLRPTTYLCQCPIVREQPLTSQKAR